ncbi:MAG TPA: HAD family hydrolase, partial [Ruminococcaceae bacterium]|nr:HAD family hydrolase [Oscillospiraceae bacterium]
KPKPDIYLFTAEKLGLAANECIAVEDSPNGVMSAHSAGCYTVMVPDLTQPDEKLESCISAVCSDLSELIELLENEGSQKS